MRNLPFKDWRLFSVTGAILTAVILVSIGIDQRSAAVSAASMPSNLGELKRQVTEYKRSGAYDRDTAAVLGNAQAYVLRRAGMVNKPAIVLDIDETSLSNWPEIQANDYGSITSGPCTLPGGPCGSVSWYASLQAEALAYQLTLPHGPPGRVQGPLVIEP